MTLRVISYGGGVQSSALLVLAATHDPEFQAAVGGPIDAALFCNTGDDSELPDTLQYVRTISIPWAKEVGTPVHELRRYMRDGSEETLLGRLVKVGGKSVPIPLRMSNGAPTNRACTVDFKIRVADKWLKEQGATADDAATVCIGFSTDEVQRVGNKNVAEFTRRSYPLLDLGLNRSACQRVIADAGLPVPPKSACYFCPFHRPQAWSEMSRGPASDQSVPGLAREPGKCSRNAAPIAALWARRDTPRLSEHAL